MIENIEKVEEKMGVQRDVFGTSKVPLQVNRTKTNFRFLVSMSLYLALWVGIIIFADVSSEFDNFFNLGNGITHTPTFEARWTIIKFNLLTVLISMSYIMLLRRFAKILIFATISIFCLLLLAAVCAFSYFYVTNGYAIYLTGTIISSITCMFTTITVIVLRKKIRIAVEIIRVSNKIVVSFPSSLCFPILPCILYMIVMIFSWCTGNSLLAEYNSRHGNSYILFFILINTFGFLWLMSFITGWSQTVLSGSFCTWYWTVNKSYVSGYNTILNFVDITIRYHLGTIACGSLMIVLRKIIRLFLNTLGRLYIPFGCYEPLFGKLEKFLMCVNHNAYVLTSSHGTEFFKSAKDAFNILIKNISSPLTINRIAEAILILGQLFIIVISTLATYAYDDHTFEPVILVAVSGIVITKSIFMVLKTAIDSIFLCILEDNKQNDDSIEKPYISKDVKTLFLQD